MPPCIYTVGGALRGNKKSITIPPDHQGGNELEWGSVETTRCPVVVATIPPINGGVSDWEWGRVGYTYHPPVDAATVEKKTPIYWGVNKEKWRGGYMPAPRRRNRHGKNAPLNEGGGGKPLGEKNKQKRGGVWYSHCLVIYTVGGGPSGGIRKKRNEAARAAGMSHNKEVGIGGAIRAPSFLVVAESPGERPCHPLHILPAPLHTLPSMQLLRSPSSYHPTCRLSR